MMNNEFYQSIKQPINQSVNPKLTLLDAYSLLSSSECRVLKKMTEGKNNRKIADELHISPKTVENHITNIGAKLMVKGPDGVRKWLQETKWVSTIRS